MSTSLRLSRSRLVSTVLLCLLAPLANLAAGEPVPHHDPSQPAVADSVLQFSTMLGVNGLEDRVDAVAAGPDGSVYAAGITQSFDLPTTQGALQPAHAGGGLRDAFVARFTPDGELIYATYFGGTGDDTAVALAVDAEGNAYITGSTSSTDLPTTPGALLSSCATGPYGCLNSAYVAKIAPGGDALAYGTYLSAGFNDAVGTAPFDEAYGIAVDADGRAYVAGSTAGPQLPGTAGRFQPAPAWTGGRDAFVAVLEPDGSAITWATYLGGTGGEAAYALARDAEGHVYVGGNTDSDDFPIVNAYQAAPRDDDYPDEGFLTKLAPDGRSAIYSTYFGGNYLDSVLGIAVDDEGQAVITGQTKSIDLPQVLAVQGPNDWTGTTGDGYVAKFSANGRLLLFSTYLGGLSFDWGSAVATDASGRTHVAVSTTSSVMPVTPDAFMVLHGMNSDAFLAILDADGALAYGTYLGGATNDEAWAVAVDASGRDIVGGFATSDNFPLMNPVQIKTYGLEAFVTVMDTSSPVARLSGATSPWSPQTGGGWISMDPPGYFECPSRCEWNFDVGAEVTLLANPDAISYFVGWSGSCGGKGPCTLALDGPRTVFADFANGDPDTDGDGLVDRDDNCVGVPNPGQQDGDDDLYGDACDCSPTDSDLYATPPEVFALRFLDGRTLAWSPAAGGATQQVYREALGMSEVGATGDAQCLSSKVAGETWDDPDTPAPGSGFRYLIRGKNGCGGGDWGEASDGTARVPADCP